MKMEKVIWIFLMLFSANSIHCMKRKFDKISLDENQSRLVMGESLISSVKDGNIDAVRKLLKDGVNPNFQDTQGKTALMYAAEKGYIDTVKLLLDHGALIFVKDNQGETAGEKVFKKIPTNWSELCDLQNEFFDISSGHLYVPHISSIVSQYADINLQEIYRDILKLLVSTAQNRAKKRKEKIKEMLHARDFGVPVTSLQNIINEYVEEDEEVANSGENYSQVESKEDEEEFYV